MKQYRNAQEIQAELGTQPQGSMQSCPEGNAARMEMLGLGASGAGRESEVPVQEGPEAVPAMEGPSGGQGAGAPGEVEAQHGSEDHGKLGGDTKVQVGPHELTTGQVNFLVDYVPSLDALAKISPEDLAKGFELIEKMENHALSPDETKEFNRIFPDYADIGLDNSDHFAPPSSGVAPTGSENFLGQIREHLGKAHDQASSGDLNGALATASWGGHYIADAFSAGHLVNKDEMMFHARALLMFTEKDVFSEAARTVVANGEEQLSRWRRRSPTGLVPIDAALLIKLYRLTNIFESRAITGAVTKYIHDRLSGDPGRPIVEVSSMGRTWLMGGDGTLDETSESICKDLIQWVYDMLDAQSDRESDTEDFIKKDALIGWVEQRLPKPTAKGQSMIDGVVKHVFKNPKNMGVALGDATLSEFDTVMESFSPLLVVKVGGDKISDPLPEVPEGDHLNGIDLEGV